MERDTSRALDRYLGRQRLDVVRAVADRSFALGYSTYLAGGLVRDLLLKIPHGDIDIVVEGDAIKLARALAKDHGGKVIAHPAFQTATWTRAGSRADPPSVDLITSRAETYSSPAALPTVRPAPIEADLRRRDFSINAMAVRLDIDRWGEFLDPLGGEQDLEAGAVRALHPRSFIDDPTRMYRAARYEKRLGFSMPVETADLISGARQYVADLSAERIRHELDLVLEDARCVQILERLAELDLLTSVHPRLGFDGGAAGRLGLAPPEDPGDISGYSPKTLRWILWLLDAAPDDLDDLGTRLGFDGKLRAALRVAIQLRREATTFAGLPPSGFARRLKDTSEIAVYALSLSERGSEAGRGFVEYLARWRHVRPATTGDALRAAGLASGPAYGRILERLRAARLDGEVSTDADEAALLNRLLQEGAHRARGSSG